MSNKSGPTKVYGADATHGDSEPDEATRNKETKRARCDNRARNGSTRKSPSATILPVALADLTHGNQESPTSLDSGTSQSMLNPPPKGLTHSAEILNNERPS